MSITRNKTVTCYSCGKKKCPLLQAGKVSKIWSTNIDPTLLSWDCGLKYKTERMVIGESSYVVSNNCKLNSITIEGKIFKPEFIISEKEKGKGKADV